MNQFTSNQFDLALNGRGWFQVNAPSGEIVYTRAGSFNKNGDGQLVTLDGYTLNPPVIVPPNTLDVTVNESGEIFAKIAGLGTTFKMLTKVWPLGRGTVSVSGNDIVVE